MRRSGSEVWHIAWRKSAGLVLIFLFLPFLREKSLLVMIPLCYFLVDSYFIYTTVDKKLGKPTRLTRQGLGPAQKKEKLMNTTSYDDSS